MRTGRYRVRRGLFNKAILQREYDFPSLIGGHVDASVRQRVWQDVDFSDLDNIRVALVPIANEKESGHD